MPVKIVIIKTIRDKKMSEWMWEKGKLCTLVGGIVNWYSQYGDSAKN